MQRLVTLLLAAGWLAATAPSIRAQGPGSPATPEAATTAPGQTNAALAATAVVAPAVTAAEIDDFKSKLEGVDLPDEQRQQINTFLQQALDDLAAAEKLQETAARFRDGKLQVASALATLTQELEAILREGPREPDPGAPLAELETSRLVRRQELDAAQGAFESHVSQLQSRPARRESLRTTLFGLQPQLAEVKQLLQASATNGDAPLLSEAARRAARAKQIRLERAMEAAQAELGFYDAEDAHDLPRLRREKLERIVALRRRELQLWESRVQAKREDALSRRISDATTGLARSAGDERLIYEGNLLLAQREREIRDLTAAVRDDAAATALAVTDLQRRFEQLQDRERKAAGSTALGLRLRQQRELLRSPDDLRHEIAARVETVEEARLDALDKSDQLDELSHLEAEVALFISSHVVPSEMTEDRWGEVVEEALRQRKAGLTELVRAYDAYMDALDDLERDQLALAALTETVTAYIDERVLWIRSHRLLDVRELPTDRSLLTALRTEGWLNETLRVLRTDVWHRPGWYGLAVLAALVLQLGRRRRRRRLTQLAQQATSRLNLELAPTLEALALTATSALFWPGVLSFIAWRLGAAAEATSFTRQLGHNLQSLAAILYLLEFTRNLLRSDGLADAHFDWGARTRTRLLSSVRWLSLCGVPILLGVALFNALHTEGNSDSWERLGFTVVLLLLARAIRDVLHPRTGILNDWRARHPEGWLCRLQPLWAWALIAVPTVLAGLSIFGYHYTAQRLASKLVITLVLLEATVVVRGLCVYWLMLQRKRLALEQARARRAALAEGATSAASATLDESVLRAPEPVDPKADLAASSTQTHRMINTSLAVVFATLAWFVWADVLPALNYINSAPVWSTLETVVQAAQLDGDAGGAPQVSVQVRSVTWADLIRVLMVTVLTFTAARNVPGLLEIAVLQRLPLDAAVRYALQAFARYCIVLVGVVLVSNLLGVDWSNIQWLAAALTFGLAFGLQEIFANFVSGLIILSEQPVRVGDVVTIDSVTGVVSRIRIRSTTITDWDRKEYIVPNKEFITGKLLNWTLSDTMNRIVIPVGVAYGSDPDHVQKVILEVAASHDNVLADPPPVVTLDNFGASALNYSLRIYLPDLKRRLETVHAIHSALVRRFREEKIEIPFPQQDLHLRTLPASLTPVIRAMEQKVA